MIKEKNSMKLMKLFKKNNVKKTKYNKIEKATIIKSKDKYSINPEHVFCVELKETLVERDSLFENEFRLFQENKCPNCFQSIDVPLEKKRKCPLCSKKITLRTNYKTKKRLAISEERLEEYNIFDGEIKKLNFLDKQFRGTLSRTEFFEKTKLINSPLLIDKAFRYWEKIKNNKIMKAINGYKKNPKNKNIIGFAFQSAAFYVGNMARIRIHQQNHDRSIELICQALYYDVLAQHILYSDDKDVKTYKVWGVKDLKIIIKKGRIKESIEDVYLKNSKRAYNTIAGMKPLTPEESLKYIEELI